MDPERNGSHTKLLVYLLNYGFQNDAADALSTVAFVNYKAHQAVKGFPVHLFLVRFPGNGFSQQNHANIFPYLIA